MSHCIYTVQLNNAHLAEEADIPCLDVTVKSGIQAFAPTWEMVWGIKTESTSPAEYTEEYLRMMRRSQQTHPQLWNHLLQMPVVALGCYCAAGKFCHRHLLKDELLRLHHQRGDDAVDGGELLQ